MGNEASSVRIHAALTAEDIKGLRGGFPGGGNGPAPAHLDFGPWETSWDRKLRLQLEKILIGGTSGAGGPGQPVVTFHAYQEMAGNVVRGTTEARVKLLFRLLDCPSDKTIKSSDLETFVGSIVTTAAKMVKGQDSPGFAEATKALTKSLLHEVLFAGETKKSCLNKEPSDDLYLDFDLLERWLVMKCQLFEEIYLYSLANSFGVPVTSATTGIRRTPLVPLQGWNQGEGTRLTPQDVFFLNHQLPPELRYKWRLLFNSDAHGESFAKMSAAITNRGPTLVIVWEEESGYVLGGFASDSWVVGPKFFGRNSSFLFHLRPKMYSYESDRFNSNYLYFNIKQKTMPNGLGMGGQLEYFGLWLDSEYGKGRCAPSCSTFQSPQLSREENFSFKHLEVWGLGEEPERDDENKRSALDMDPEAQAMMEMMGKTFVSKDVKAQDEQSAKDKKEQERHDFQAEKN